jgi:hypothetical protein
MSNGLSARSLTLEPSQIWHLCLHRAAPQWRSGNEDDDANGGSGRYVTSPLPVDQTRLEDQLLVMQQQVPAQWLVLAAVPQEPAQLVPAR